MPTSTFLNLPEKKRERLLSAARREFSRTTYEKVSINRIIQDAGISRGSFYMYFEDKADLLKYILNDYIHVLIDGMKESLLRNQGNIFEMMKEFFRTTVHTLNDHENADFFQQVFSQWQIMMEAADLSRPFMQNKQEFENLLSLVNMDLLNIQSDKDKDDILEILSFVTKKAVVEVFRKPENTHVIQDSYDNKIEILKRGMMCANG